MTIKLLFPFFFFFFFFLEILSFWTYPAFYLLHWYINVNSHIYNIDYDMYHVSNNINSTTCCHIKTWLLTLHTRIFAWFATPSIFCSSFLNHFQIFDLFDVKENENETILGTSICDTSDMYDEPNTTVPYVTNVAVVNRLTLIAK